MEEIDISELLSYIRSKIPFLILIIFLVCIGGCLYSIFLKTPLYQSSSTIVLASGDGSNNVTVAGAEVALNQKLVGTYQEIVKSRSVVESVIQSLDLNQNYEELLEKISVSSVDNTEIIKITVTEEKASDAKKITSSLASTFSKEIAKIYNMKNVNILDEASTPKTAYNMNLTKEFILYFAFGFILGMGIICIMFYFDKTIRSVEQVENKLGLPILGTVPVLSGKGGH